MFPLTLISSVLLRFLSARTNCENVLIFGLVRNSQRVVISNTLFSSSPLWLQTVLCFSQLNTIRYSLWFQWVVLNLLKKKKNKNISYWTLSIEKGLINKWVEVIIEAGIDHRMLNRCWSAVLILMVVVDEVKWLSEIVKTCTQQDFHRAEGVLLSC